MLLHGALAAAAVAAACAWTDVLPLPLVCNVLLAVLGYFLTSHMTVATKAVFVKARLFGIDLNKPETKRDANGVLIRPYEGPIVAEAMGAITCTVYLVCMFIFIPLPFVHDYASRTAVGGGWGGASSAASSAATEPYHFPHAHLSKFLCALLAICCMCFLGFADNVLDLRWRDRLWLPLAASLPLLMVYAVDGGGTVIVLPRVLTPLLGASVELGILYYVFMASLAIFCTNSINILAGVNGLECGQAVVIAATVLLNNVIQLYRWPDGPLHDNNLFSLYLTLPFLGCSLATLKHNWYPSEVFVGDTYCYFAGMTFAVVGILGHNAKTVLLFFLPQLLNFLYSLPQLAKIIPCPRHRMPAFLPKTNQVTNSFTEFEPEDLRRPGKLVLWLCETLRLAKVERSAGKSTIRMSNLTIINYVLYVCGPMNEATLTSMLLLLQVVLNGFGLLVRYQLASLFYDIVK